MNDLETLYRGCRPTIDQSTNRSIRPALDPKSLWKESAQIRPTLQVYASIGRQQQAGTREYLTSWHFFSNKEQKRALASQSVGILGCAFGTPDVIYIVYNAQEEAIEFIDLGTEPFFQFLTHIAKDHDWEWPIHAKSLAEGIFLEPIERLERFGNIDAALDLLYDKIDWFLKEKQFNEIEHFLNSIDTNTLSMDLLLGILTATLPARSQLSSRRSFFLRVEATLKERGQWENGLLVGLEN